MKQRNLVEKKTYSELLRIAKCVHVFGSYSYPTRTVSGMEHIYKSTLLTDHDVCTIYTPYRNNEPPSNLAHAYIVLCTAPSKRIAEVLNSLWCLCLRICLMVYVYMWCNWLPAIQWAHSIPSVGCGSRARGALLMIASIEHTVYQIRNEQYTTLI